MNQKNNFNNFSNDELKTEKELNEDRINKIFLNGILKRMNQEKYI